MRRKSRQLTALLLAVLSFLPFSGCGGRSERAVPVRQELESCGPEACTLVWEGCCPPCAGGELSRYHAVRRENAEAFFASACPNSNPCPACSEPLPPLVAACTPDGCDVVDLARDDAIACKSDGDCRVRTKDCCECGGRLSKAHLIAISDEERYSELVCPESWGCDDCLPGYPSAATPRCESGRCTLYW